jgi:hypothetical protein
MNTNQPIRVTADLTPITKTSVQCAGHLEFNSLNQPEKLTLILTGLEETQVNRFCQPQLTVKDVFGQAQVVAELPDGDQFQAEIVYIKHVGFGEQAAVELECYLGNVSEQSVAAPAEQAGYWNFGLSNYKIFRGDAWTEQPPPPASTLPR